MVREVSGLAGGGGRGRGGGGVGGQEPGQGGGGGGGKPLASNTSSSKSGGGYANALPSGVVLPAGFADMQCKLKKRVAQLFAYVLWCRKQCFCYPFPFTPQVVFEYLQHLKVWKTCPLKDNRCRGGFQLHRAWAPVIKP